MVEEWLANAFARATQPPNLVIRNTVTHLTSPSCVLQF
jgi:hypothetical protein